jgi:hypothetical protein
MAEERAPRDGPPLVWISNRAESQCKRCGTQLAKGNFITLEKGSEVCMSCSGFADLVFLPSGDTALTRRAVKHSSRHAIVLKWSKARGRNERQGVLVEPSAIEKAQEDNVADAEKRERQREVAAERREHEDAEYRRRFTVALRERYPGCPRSVADRIVAHACEKYSGRVGRSAMAKELEPDAIDLAVRAHVRHARTGYDELLAGGADRFDARHFVSGEIEEVLARWRRETR